MHKHNEDLNLIPLVQQTIETIVDKYPTYFLILVGDFSWDILLIGRQTQHTTVIPLREESEYNEYTTDLKLTLIPNTSHFTSQEGPNYTHTKMIVNFNINKSPPPTTTITITYLKPMGRSHDRMNQTNNSLATMQSKHVPHPSTLPDLTNEKPMWFPNPQTAKTIEKHLKTYHIIKNTSPSLPTSTSNWPYKS